jgi:chromosome partitioning protein
LLFGEKSIADCVVGTRVPRLSIVPSSMNLSGAEIELVTMENREFRMKAALDTIGTAYDYVVVDCPPALNLTTLNVLVAADAVIVPLQCEFYALEGLAHLTKTIERVRKSFNPSLMVHGVVLTMYDVRNRLSGMVADDVRSYFGDTVYKTVIPRNVRVSEAPSYGLPAIVYDMRCAGSQAYIQLAKEVIKREKTLLSDERAVA